MNVDPDAIEQTTARRGPIADPRARRQLGLRGPGQVNGSRRRRATRPGSGESSTRTRRRAWSACSERARHARGRGATGNGTQRRLTAARWARRRRRLAGNQTSLYSYSYDEEVDAASTVLLGVADNLAKAQLDTIIANEAAVGVSSDVYSSANQVVSMSDGSTTAAELGPSLGLNTSAALNLSADVDFTTELSQFSANPHGGDKNGSAASSDTIRFGLGDAGAGSADATARRRLSGAPAPKRSPGSNAAPTTAARRSRRRRAPRRRPRDGRAAAGADVGAAESIPAAPTGHVRATPAPLKTPVELSSPGRRPRTRRPPSSTRRASATSRRTRR